MPRKTVMAVIAGMSWTGVGVAQTSAPLMAGTRLDLNVTGVVSRTPDIATISTGVLTQAATATEALRQNAARMERVRAALKRAGVADRDVQTTTVSLNPQFRYRENQAPLLTSYQASNQLSVRYRDIRQSGAILDALVGEGANQINGPNLSVDQPAAALDEARAKAIAIGRARADLYARSLGMRVVKIVSVSENGASPPPPMPPMVMMRAQAADAKTVIDPGEQQIDVTVSMSFELQ